jgi:hypothetical protein
VIAVFGTDEIKIVVTGAAGVIDSHLGILSRSWIRLKPLD